ncbi:MAG: acetate--CoA ligase family protein, partial [Pseudomonadota bacterium]
VDLAPGAARRDFVSSTFGNPTAGEALDCAYWWRNARRPVRFREAVAALLDSGVGRVLEIGPRPVLQAYVRDTAAAAAAELGFPVALKALDARLLHKTEAGALRLSLADPAAVSAAAVAMGAEMATRVPDIPLNRVLVEAMAPPPVAEIMSSISHDPSVGPVMLIAGGG